MVITCYGAVAAFEGDEGIDGFEEGYEKLIDMIRSRAGSRIAPLVFQCVKTLVRLPNMNYQNVRLSKYSKIIKDIAVRKIMRLH